MNEEEYKLHFPSPNVCGKIHLSVLVVHVHERSVKMLFSQRSACDRCRALKSRCSREPGAAKCERCQRLQIDCFYSPPRRMGRPAKKRLNQETASSTPSNPYRRSSTMSIATNQTSHSDVIPPSSNEASEFHYGLGIIPSHPNEDGAWTENFEDPLLGLLHSNDTRHMPTEWLDADSMGMFNHQEDAMVTESNGMPITPPATIGSLPNSSDDMWMPGCDQAVEMGHARSFADDTFPPSPEMHMPAESAPQRLLDLQTRLFLRPTATANEADGLTLIINTTVHATESLIDIVESLPQLRPSVEGQQSASPSATTQHALESQQKQSPNHALTISLYNTSYLLLLDLYEELLTALRARLQCSRQSQGPSPASDFGLAPPFFGNTPGGNLNKFNLVSSFDLDVNSVVFLLSRMMKRLHKSTESRFVAASMASGTSQLTSQGFPATHASLNYDFQDGASQDTDGVSEPCMGGAYSAIALMGDYASREVSQRHRSVMESLRVIRWLADEL